jgi:enoyl-CoA hydratase
MLTGRDLGAEEAYEIGLIDRLVEDGGAEEAALDLARDLRRLSQPALHAVIRTVDVASHLPLPEGLRREALEEQRLFDRGEAREGIAAFIEKRHPRFE